MNQSIFSKPSVIIALLAMLVMLTAITMSAHKPKVTAGSVEQAQQAIQKAPSAPVIKLKPTARAKPEYQRTATLACKSAGRVMSKGQAMTMTNLDVEILVALCKGTTREVGKRVASR